MKREMNKQYNRRQLIESAMQLLSSRDYQRVTVEEIARNAGVTKTTFFAHFKSKEEILFEIDVNQLTALDEDLASYPMDGEFHAKLVNAIVEMALNLHSTPILTQNLIHLGTISEKYRTYLADTFTNLKGILRKYFEHSQAFGLISKTITAERVAEDFVILYIGVMVRWGFFDGDNSLEYTLREALTNYSSGIYCK